MKYRTGAVLLAAGAYVVLLGGCGYLSSLFFGELSKYGKSPLLPSIRTVAVMPFFDLTDNDHLQKTNDGYDSLRLAKLFADEWAQFEGFEPILRPQQVLAQMQQMGLTSSPGDPQGPEKAVALGRALKADLVVAGGITEFDPYNRPRVGIVLQVFHTGGKTASLDLSRLQQTGRPFPVGPGMPGRAHVAASFERVYDSSRERTWADVNKYSIGLNDEDRGVEAPQMVTDDMERYLRFVGYMTIRDFFALAPDELKRR